MRNGSFVDINERREAFGCELAARAHCYRDSMLIVSSIAGMYEHGPVTALDLTSTDAALGEAIWTHLLAFELRSPEAPVTRRTDWAAFRASGAHTVREFG